jgi:hypothetical protein
MSWPPWNGSIAELAALEESPLSDGMLHEWTEKQRVSVDDVPALAALVRSADPHLQEAGVDLATALLGSAPPGTRSATRAALEPALAAIVGPGLDPYVVEALAELLEHHPLMSVIAALVCHHVDEHAPRVLPTTPPVPRATPPGRFILRNRLPRPWLRLEALYARLALAAGDAPTARDLAYLPVLEARHGTHGWSATLAALEQPRGDMRR